MGDELVLPLLELLDQEGIALGRHRVHRDAGPDLVAVEHVEHAEDAGAVAVLALRPGAVVGHCSCRTRRRSGVSLMAALGRHAARNIRDAARTKKATRALLRPGELGPRRERRVVVPGIVHPGLERRRVLGNGGGAHLTPPSRDAAGRASRPFADVPVEDLLGGADPGVLVLADVGQRPVEMLQPMRRAHHVGMERDAHHAAVLAALAIDRVEMVDDHLREFLGLDRLAVDHRVVDIHRVGHVDQRAVLGRERRRLVVVIEVAEVVEARLLHEVGRVERVGDGGREPAAQLAAGQAQVRGLAVLDDLALLLGRHSPSGSAC